MEEPFTVVYISQSKLLVISVARYEAAENYSEMDSMYANSMAVQYCQPYLVCTIVDFQAANFVTQNCTTGVIGKVCVASIETSILIVFPMH